MKIDPEIMDDGDSSQVPENNYYYCIPYIQETRVGVNMLSSANNIKKTKIRTYEEHSKFNNEKTNHLLKITSKIFEHFAKEDIWMEIKTMETFSIISH